MELKTLSEGLEAHHTERRNRRKYELKSFFLSEKIRIWQRKIIKYELQYEFLEGKITII